MTKFEKNDILIIVYLAYNDGQYEAKALCTMT